MNAQQIKDKADEIAENSYAKLIARIVLPIVVAVVGSLGTYVLNDLRTSIKEMRTESVTMNTRLWDAQKQAANNLARAVADIRVVSQKVDDNRLRSDDADIRLGVQLDALSTRVEALRYVR